MSICIWRGMKSGEHPVGGEKVSVLCPELVEKEDARHSAVVYYICIMSLFSFPLTKCRVTVCRILIFFLNRLFSKYIKACF